VILNPHVPTEDIQNKIPVATKNSHVIDSWKGDYITNTTIFHVSSDEWKIKWITKPGGYGSVNFQIYVYKSDGSLKCVAANVIGKSSDYIILKGAGNYYLFVNTLQPYEITVESLS
jgi:hypothetical protein